MSTLAPHPRLAAAKGPTARAVPAIFLPPRWRASSSFFLTNADGELKVSLQGEMDGNPDLEEFVTMECVNCRTGAIQEEE